MGDGVIMYEHNMSSGLLELDKRAELEIDFRFNNFSNLESNTKVILY